MKVKTSILVAAIISFVVLAAGAVTVEGKVIGVIDGDTIEVLDATKTPHRIRLGGIDAPEKAQAFGNKSKQHLSDLVFGKQVEVQAHKTDDFGRTVGKVLVNGTDANFVRAD
jgi:endonuclease YncB( thermonuclease family)